jgi:hypothetical protein
MGTKGKTFHKGIIPFDPGIPDHAVVNKKELALAIRRSRWTIDHWIDDLGYQMEFGNTTTPGHCKAWMRDNKHRLKERTPKQEKEEVRYQEAQARLK